MCIYNNESLGEAVHEAINNTEPNKWFPMGYLYHESFNFYPYNVNFRSFYSMACNYFNSTKINPLQIAGLEQPNTLIHPNLYIVGNARTRFYGLFKTNASAIKAAKNHIKLNRYIM